MACGSSLIKLRERERERETEERDQGNGMGGALGIEERVVLNRYPLHFYIIILVQSTVYIIDTFWVSFVV